MTSTKLKTNPPNRQTHIYAHHNFSGMTEITTDTTDRNDRHVAVGGISNGAGQGVGSPQIIVINFFLPTQHPIARVIGNYAAARSVVSNTCTTGRSLQSVVSVVTSVIPKFFAPPKS